MTSEDFVEAEFWWLSELGFPVLGRVGVARSRWTDPMEDPHFARMPGQMNIRGLGDWAAQNQLENVHRTLEVVGVPGSEEPIVGPIVVDVDTDEESFGHLAMPSDDLITLAKDLTLDVLRLLRSQGVLERHRRVYFSGHKGFHVHYILPSNLDMHRLQARDGAEHRRANWRNEMKKLRDLIGEADQGRVFIDNVHKYVRLRSSINRWGPPGSDRQHRVIQISETELDSIMVDELWGRSIESGEI